MREEKKQKKKLWPIIFLIIVLLMVCVGILIKIGIDRQSAADEERTAESTGELVIQQEEEMQQLADEVTEDSAEADEIMQTYFLYENYTGYLDESYEWAGYTNFVEQDYDEDGTYDRVYREFVAKENSTYACNYRIELGNGSCIEISDTDTVGTPEIVTFDMTGDGQKEILFRQTYEMSTDPRSGGAFTLYEKQGDVYQVAELSFERGWGGSNVVEMLTEQDGYTYRFKIPSFDFTQAIYVPDYEFWNQYRDFYTEEGQKVPVWYAEPVELDDTTGLKCYIHLFDKWSGYGIEITVVYRDGEYVTEGIDFTDDIHFGMKDENGALKAEYAVYEEILSNPTEHLINPHSQETKLNGSVYAGVYDFDSDGVKEIIFGDKNGISIYSCAEGTAKKIKELYMPEEWGSFDELYFEYGALVLVSKGTDSCAYVCWNGAQTGYYCENEYPWAYMDEEKTPYNVFVETFSVKWITENSKAMPQIRFRGDEITVNEEV